MLPQNVLDAVNAFLVGQGVFNTAGPNDPVFGPQCKITGVCPAFNPGSIIVDILDELIMAGLGNYAKEMFAKDGVTVHEFTYSYNPEDVGDGTYYFAVMVPQEKCKLFFLMRMAFSYPNNYVVELVMPLYE